MVASISSVLQSHRQQVETRCIQFTSPLLHIGSELQRLSPFEYVQTEKRVFLPNIDELGRQLYAKNLLEDYIETIKERRSLVLFLERAFGEHWLSAKAADGSALFPKHMSSRKWIDERILELRPMLRDKFGYPYIPGSSIKGAIRTAIAYHLLKHAEQVQLPQQQSVSQIEQMLRERLRKKDLKPKKSDDSLMGVVFTEFNLSYQGKVVPSAIGPNTDFMRAIKVSDSEPLIEKEIQLKNGKKRIDNWSVVAEVLVSSYYQNDNAKYRASIYAEMIRGVNTTFTLTLDHELLSRMQHQHEMRLPFQSIDELLKICQTFATDQWHEEHDYWNALSDNPRDRGRILNFGEIRKFYEPETCPYQLRLGWGSGMNGTTIGLLLPQDLRSQLRDACGIAAPRFDAPKSRRTVFNSKGESQLLLGWAKLKSLESC